MIWPIPSPQAGLEDFSRRCVVGNTNGKLAVSFCRVVAGPYAACVGASGSEITVERSHLSSLSGACLAWDSTLGSVRITQCVLEGKIALFTITAKAGRIPTRIDFAFNTVVAERVMNLIVFKPVRKSLTFTASRNLIDSQVLIALFTIGGFQQTSETTARMTDMLGDAVAWRDESNVYRRGSLYLAGNVRQQPLSTFPSDLNALVKWLEFWKQPASKSIEAIIRFGERSGPGDTTLLPLRSIDAPSGPVPPDVGANPAETGPGAAFHARQTGPERR